MAQADVTQNTCHFGKLLKDFITLTTGRDHFTDEENQVIEGAVSDGVVTSDEFYSEFSGSSKIMSCGEAGMHSNDWHYKGIVDHRLCLSKGLYEKITGGEWGGGFTYIELRLVFDRLKIKPCPPASPAKQAPSTTPLQVGETPPRSTSSSPKNTLLEGLLTLFERGVEVGPIPF